MTLPKLLPSIFSLLTLSLAPAAFCFNPVENVYRDNCANCHGKNLEGGLGSSLIDDIWVHGNDPASIAQSIAKGFPNKGMPAWEDTLSEGQIRSLVVFIIERNKNKDKQKTETNIPEDGTTFEAAGYKFELRKVDEVEGMLWAMDFLPDGSILGTQHQGNLFHFKDGKKTKIKNIPLPWVEHQAGLLDVAVHPEYEKNGWVYLSFSDHQGKLEDGGKAGMTRVVRGKIKDDTWVNQEDIINIDKTFHNRKPSHFGSRIVFKDGYVYISIGERHIRDLAQDLSRINGKIIRLHDDGSVPEDNPFMPSDSVVTGGIWTYGHRNPQGLAIHPVTKDIWASEHGPRGGDEINLIEKGLNYGWPVISHGINYDGTPVSDLTEKEGMQQPIHYWTPSIAVSAIDFYQGELFNKWKNKLLVASLGSQELHLLTIENNKVIKDEILFKDQARIREVVSGPDGAIYLSLNHGKGRIYKMLPVESK